ncbi:MAG: CCA tRNA nucleotidyltransferase [Rickettsiaceae bacterium]|nr:CCA tRNA nucleotidyltransferase [Rickettsiaceae bacterium]
MKVIKKCLKINSPNYLRLLEILTQNGGYARVVGGAVRNCLLSIPANDIDIATNLLPTQVIDILYKEGIKIIPTGIDHGTVSALFTDEIIQITTLRKDIKCFGRKAEVTFTDSFYEDATRRDFTINALSYCVFKEEIYDYFDGISDLNTKIVKFIGNAEERINEDYLRILRFFRFSHRFAKKLDQAALDACIKLKEKLLSLSHERIKSEMDLILSAQGNEDILQKIYETGILNIIYPGSNYTFSLQQNLLTAVKFYQCSDHLTRLASYSLIFSSVKMLNIKFLLNLRFSKSEATTIISFINFCTNIQNELHTRLNLVYAGLEDYCIFFALAEITTGQIDLIRKQFTQLQLSAKPVFPINGNDLKAKNINIKNIGTILTDLKTKWAASNFTLNKEDLITLLNKL